MTRSRRNLLRRLAGTATVLGLGGCLRLRTRGTTTPGGTGTPDRTASTAEPTATTGTETPSRAEREEAADADTETDADGSPSEVRLGAILPQSGALADAAEGMLVAVELALAEVGDAGGPLGGGFEFDVVDSGTDPNRAVEAYRELVAAGFVGVVGAAGSDVSRPLARQAAEQQVPAVSPSSTSPLLSDAGRNGDRKYFGRTVRNDAQQGLALARAMNDQLGAETAVFLTVDNAWGQSQVEWAAEAFGGEFDVHAFAPDTSDFSPILEELGVSAPSAVGFIGFENHAATVLGQWVDGGGYGIAPEEWVLVGSAVSTDLRAELGEDGAGIHTVGASPEPTEGMQLFRERSDAADAPFAPHAYDAVFVLALAVAKAGEPSGPRIAESIRSVTRPPGETVTVGEFGRARELLASGEAVNYEGAAGHVDLTENLEPVVRVAVRRFTGDGGDETVATIPASWFAERL